MGDKVFGAVTVSVSVHACNAPAERINCHFVASNDAPVMWLTEQLYRLPLKVTVVAGAVEMQVKPDDHGIALAHVAGPTEPVGPATPCGP